MVAFSCSAFSPRRVFPRLALEGMATRLRRRKIHCGSPNRGCYMDRLGEAKVASLSEIRLRGLGTPRHLPNASPQQVYQAVQHFLSHAEDGENCVQSFRPWD